MVSPCFVPKAEADTTPLAIVNGTPITNTDLEWEMKQLETEMRLRNRPLNDQQIQALRGQLIENLIEREVLYQHAKAENIHIRSQSIASSLSELKDQLGGSQALRDYLSSSGMTNAQLKERLAKGLSVQYLLRKEPIRAIKVSNAETNAYYRQHPELFERGEQVRVRQILISVNNMNDEGRRLAAKEKLETLRRQIENGANFAVLALEYSDGPSKARAGDLGYLTRDQMIASFAAAAFSLKPGEVSDIVETRFGYHLIKMIDRKPPAPLAYIDVREKIERTIRRDKENRAVRNYVAELSSQAEIQRPGGI